MSASFFFYDLETSGINPREARIMQFAGQRTDLQLNPIGDPYNILVRLSDEVLPEPDAILITGITPQQAKMDGVTEAEFLKVFTEQIATRDTIFMGYNTVRFDDEFMRYAHYRNFYDPYEWQWQDGRTRWDLLDIVRMTRALRPDGIKWPVDSTGKATNRLELLTAANKLEHTDAHDALSDVNATIAVARLIRNKQTKLFEYLLGMRTKQKVAELVEAGEPFVYSSGRYPSEYEKTTVAVKLTDNPTKQGVLVYDLRHDPKQFASMTSKQLLELLRYQEDPKALRLPVKAMQYNRCPAVAPMGVLDEASQKRLGLDLQQVAKHRAALKQMSDFPAKVAEAFEMLQQEQQAKYAKNDLVDAQLYDGFFGNGDKPTMSAVRASEPAALGNFATKLHDKRLKALLPLYKARNYPQALDDEERGAWEAFRAEYLLGGGQQSRMHRFYARLQELAQSGDIDADKSYLLQELQLYAESIMPVDSVAAD